MRNCNFSTYFRASLFFLVLCGVPASLRSEIVGERGAVLYADKEDEGRNEDGEICGEYGPDSLVIDVAWNVILRLLYSQWVFAVNLRSIVSISTNVIFGKR